MMFIEMHCHTIENDIVVDIETEELIKQYYDRGYKGLVVTNHFSTRAFEWFKNELEGKNDRERIDFWLRGYRNAKKAGEKLGMKIYLGIELRFENNINDFLIYGIDEKFLYDNPNLNKLSLKEVYGMLPENAAIIHAHPFRKGMTVCEPEFVTGYEIYNGATSDFRNSIAKTWAEHYGKKVTSGSDTHNLQNLGKGGICVERLPDSENELGLLVKSGEYKLIRKGEKSDF